MRYGSLDACITHTNDRLLHAQLALPRLALLVVQKEEEKTQVHGGRFVADVETVVECAHQRTLAVQRLDVLEHHLHSLKHVVQSPCHQTLVRNDGPLPLSETDTQNVEEHLIVDGEIGLRDEHRRTKPLRTCTPSALC